MFKSLIKKLEEENLPTNGTAIRESIRDAGQAVMKQVREKVEAVSSASSSATSSRAQSLIDFTADPLPASSPPPDQALVSELGVVKRERDGLLLRNGQLNNLISQMKAELAEERNLRHSLEEEYKRPNEEIPFKVLLEKGVQTEAVAAAADAASAEEEEEVTAAELSRERDQLLLRNAELSNSIETLKRQLNEDHSERKEIEDELRQLRAQLLAKEAQLLQELEQEKERQRQQAPAQEVISRKEHDEVVQRLEETINEKSKTIRLQLQRISDIKKSIQRGDFPPVPSLNHNNNASSFHASTAASAAGYFSDNETSRTASPSLRRDTQSPPATLDLASHTNMTPADPGSDHASTTLNVNFEYLKNVVFKFITSSEYESQKQLVKAISTLLQFSEQEEHSVRETLEWRASWLSSLPLVGPNLKPHATSAPASLKGAPAAASHSKHTRREPRNS